MDDPWDVKSVRQPGLYTSYMKINGIPLLPPVLSKECRKEMQYYKLLAKEVEKRISILQPYVLDADSSDEKTDASEIPECEKNYEFTKEDIHINKVEMENAFDQTLTSSPLHTELYNVTDKVVDINNASPLINGSTSLDEANKKLNIIKKNTTPPIEVPEKDYNCTKTSEVLIETDKMINQSEKVIQSIVSYNFSVTRDVLDSFSENISQDGPPSLSSKSFTGSLNNIHLESSKDNVKKLVRQRSYTLLNPSPQLLAHLEMQSLSTGVEMSCISMSESYSNLYSPNKKRRSWDLESAKLKWSKMAKELKQKNLGNPINRNKIPVSSRKTGSPPRAKSVNSDRIRQNVGSKSPYAKTEPLHQTRKSSPVRNPSNRTIGKELNKTGCPKTNPINKIPQEPTSTIVQNHMTPKNTQKQDQNTPKRTAQTQLISESEDPATKVRELYEKIQKQQLMQMASLVEKQKREQLLLQQVFEEQNNLLFKQLKTICPKSPIEAKQAWGDKSQESNRGPVSLSQLINHKPDDTISDNVSTMSALNDSSKYLNQCDSALRKSRNLSGNLKSQEQNNGHQTASPPRAQGEESRTRTNSPHRRNTPTSRRLNYDTRSSDREYDPILSDRTNDTMADLNVTFPSDTEEYRPISNTGVSLDANELTVIHTVTPSNSARSTDSAIRCMEQSIHNSMSSSTRRGRVINTQPTPREQAAARIISAYAKGYLVRRLMRTARVQATVQTIRDALLCALQLHQERSGIRGADVDLHRRLIQQITAACYSLHDTFITRSARERCALIAADRARPKPRHEDVMSQSHSGAFPARPRRVNNAAIMTRSSYESYGSAKGRARYMPPPRLRPWR